MSDSDPPSGIAKYLISAANCVRKISIKKFLYASRALLACRWIRQHKSQPPTEFQALVDEVANVDERIYFADLLTRKSETPEKGEIVLEQSGREAITAELENYEGDATSLEASPKNSLQQLDTTLRQWVGGSTQ
jgi:predicted nucleotidyltransferase